MLFLWPVTTFSYKVTQRYRVCHRNNVQQGFTQTRFRERKVIEVIEQILGVRRVLYKGTNQKVSYLRLHPDCGWNGRPQLW